MNEHAQQGKNDFHDDWAELYTAELHAVVLLDRGNSTVISRAPDVRSEYGQALQTVGERTNKQASTTLTLGDPGVSKPCPGAREMLLSRVHHFPQIEIEMPGKLGGPI